MVRDRTLLLLVGFKRSWLRADAVGMKVPAPLPDRLAACGMGLFVGGLGFVCAAGLATGASAYSTLPTAIAVLAFVAIGMWGARTAYRAWRAGISVGEATVRVSDSRGTRHIPTKDVLGFEVNPATRICELRTNTGARESCSMLGYGPMPPPQLRRAVEQKVVELNRALAAAHADSALSGEQAAQTTPLPN